VTVRVPPLRERQGDSLLLAQFILQQLSERFGKPTRGLAPDAIRAIQAYRWQRAEAQAVRQSLAVARGNLSRAAELLGVTRPTLYDLLGKHGIDAAQFGRHGPPAADSAAPEPPADNAGGGT
jgi:two-component system NtrC family response regulator